MAAAPNSIIDISSDDEETKSFEDYSIKALYDFDWDADLRDNEDPDINVSKN